MSRINRIQRLGRLFGIETSRPGDCKYRELIFKTEITDFFIFCQEKPFDELFSKLRLKLAREFLILRNPTKSRIAVFALRPQKIQPKTWTYSHHSWRKTPGSIKMIFYMYVWYHNYNTKMQKYCQEVHFHVGLETPEGC